MKYCKAYRADGSQILGNCDGQTVYRGQYRRTKHYKALVSGENRPKWETVRYWRIVDESGTFLKYVPNIFWLSK